MGFLSMLIGPLFKLLDKAIDSNEERAKIKAKLQEMIITGQAAELEAATKVIVAEAQGESWMQRNWRPSLMYIIMFLLVYVVFVAPIIEASFNVVLDIEGSLSSIPAQMWALLSIGVGGYVGGRTIEKSVKLWKEPEVERSRRNIIRQESRYND